MKALTLSPTNKCPLQCSHCGPSSGPNESLPSSIDYLKPIISDFSKRGYQYINITGGEPFLLGQQLVELVRFAVVNKIGCRVTTGAYWSKDEKIALKKLQPLADAGLKDLYISVSDGHLNYLPINNLFYASKVARSLGITVTIGLLSFVGTKLTVRAIIDFFRSQNEPMPFVNDAPVIPFGRASDKFAEPSLRLKPVKELEGPCPAVMNHPMIHPNGDVSACSSVFSHEMKSLIFGNITSESVDELCNKMDTNPYYIWIHQFGPYALKQMIEKVSDVSFSTHYVNICHLCGDIASNRRALDVLKKEKLL